MKITNIELVGTILKWICSAAAFFKVQLFNSTGGDITDEKNSMTTKPNFDVTDLTKQADDVYMIKVTPSDGQIDGETVTIRFKVYAGVITDLAAEAAPVAEDQLPPRNQTEEPEHAEQSDVLTALVNAVNSGAAATVTAMKSFTTKQEEANKTLQGVSTGIQAIDGSVKTLAGQVAETNKGLTDLKNLGGSIETLAGQVATATKRFEAVENVGNDIRAIGAGVKTLVERPVKEEKRKWLRGVIIAAVATAIICLFTWWCVSRHYSKGSAPVGKTPQMTNSSGAITGTNAPSTNDTASIEKIGTAVIPAGAAITAPKKNGRKKSRSLEVLDLATGKQYTTNSLPDQQVTEIDTLVEYPAGMPVAVTFDNRFSNLSNCTLSNVTINMGTQISGSTVGNHYAPPQAPIPQQGPTHDWQGSQVAPQQVPPADFQQGQPVSQVVQPAYGYAQPTYYAQEPVYVSAPYYQYGGYYGGCNSSYGVGIGFRFGSGYGGHRGGTVINHVNRPVYVQQRQSPTPRSSNCYNGGGGRSGGRR
jgi:hypothetical protein